MELNIHKNNRRILAPLIRPGDVCVDATAGRGYDTLFLAEQVGPDGTVFTFDIQKAALDSTAARLAAAKLSPRVQLIHESHVHIPQYVHEPVRTVLFNLGYLPGSDHALRTRAKDSLTACTKCLPLLQIGGVLSVVVYRDGIEGAKEYETIRAWAAYLNAAHYAVLEMAMMNMPNEPPLQIFIERLR